VVDIFSDIYFEVDNEDALLESIMGEDKIAVTALFIPFPPLPNHFMNLSAGKIGSVASKDHGTKFPLSSCQYNTDDDLVPCC